jgi:hypothetical protein
MNLKEIRLGSVNWIHLVQVTAQWPVIINVAMFFGFYERQGTAWPPNDLSPSEGNTLLHTVVQ